MQQQLEADEVQNGCPQNYLLKIGSKSPELISSFPCFESERCGSVTEKYIAINNSLGLTLDQGHEL